MGILNTMETILTVMEDKEEVVMVEVDINSELGLEARVVG